MWSCSQIMHQWKKEGKLHCISLLGQLVFTLEVTQKLIHMQNFKFVICYLFTAITICHLSNYFAGPGVTISFHNFRCLELKWGESVYFLYWKALNYATTSLSWLIWLVNHLTYMIARWGSWQGTNIITILWF